MSWEPTWGELRTCEKRRRNGFAHLRRAAITYHEALAVWRDAVPVQMRERFDEHSASIGNAIAVFESHVRAAQESLNLLMTSGR